MEVEISEPHTQMLEALRDAHDEGIDQHLRERVEAEIHESFRQLRE
jgi:hypothetical protein